MWNFSLYYNIHFHIITSALCYYFFFSCIPAIYFRKFTLQCSKWILTAQEETPTAKPKLNALRNDQHATLPKMLAPVKMSI